LTLVLVFAVVAYGLLLESVKGIAHHHPGVLVLVVGGYFGWRFVSRPWREKAEAILVRKKVSALAERHNAITDWQKPFGEHGMKTGRGHRAVYTMDIEKALIQSDGQLSGSA